MKSLTVAVTKHQGFKWYSFLFFFLALYVMPSYAQDRDLKSYIGLNFLNNYGPETYGLQPQNWAIAQDQRGMIYVANQGGLLEYDGVSWRAIDILNNFVRSLAIAEDGTIYLGGNNEIGFLEPDSQGTLHYNSLLGHVPDRQRNFSWVWRVHATREGIFFRTSKYLFRWNSAQQQLKVWESDNYFLASFTFKGTLYIQQKKAGLMQLKDDSLKLLPGSELFADTKIYMMVPGNTDHFLLLTGQEGFYHYRIGSAPQPFPTRADGYLKEKDLYHGFPLSSGDFALATSRGGLLITDPKGNIKKLFNQDSGLQDDSIKYGFEDLEGNLWLALEKGIAKIEYASPIAVYDANRSNLPGLVLTVVRHGPRQDLYVGTTRGLFRLESPTSVKFHAVAGISTSCFCLLSRSETLLAATASGVFQVDNPRSIHRVTAKGAYVLVPSEKQSRRIWGGTTNGLISITYRENKRWVKEKSFNRVLEQVRTIIEEPDGSLWLGTEVEGVLQIDFPVAGTSEPYVVTRYDKTHGLPAGSVRVYKAASHTMFFPDKGIFRFDEKARIFKPDDTLGKQFNSGSRQIFRIAEDSQKNLWFHSENRNIQAIPQEDGAYTLYEKPFLRIPPGQVNAIYPDPGHNLIWFAGHNGLICFDRTRAKHYRRPFAVFIRKALANGVKIFDGYPKKTGQGNGASLSIIPYENRSLQLEFAAPYFEAESRTRYQCFLEGHDRDWTGWTREPQIIYRSLDAGRYSFRVRAKNVYEDLSHEATFKFKILLPWYRTWWAFLAYSLVILLLTFLVVKWWRTRKLEQEKERLEQVVLERTREIHHKNRQLEEQSQKLKAMDKVKSRFFANISHEFRTPLTLIMGPLDQLRSQCIDQEQVRRLDLMQRNSQRLLNLINQLLDLSKLDSGRMKLDAAQHDIVPFLKGIVDAFALTAHQHQVDLIFQAETDHLILYFDPEKLENILGNLLINAVKFTPPGGKIEVSLGFFSPEFLEISVRDTGLGIPRDQLEHIFDRFYQVEEPSKAYHPKGTGIGLALCKELVNLHHGKIDVHSRTGENSGTTFIIRLPMGSEHLKAEEMGEPVPQHFPGDVNNGERKSVTAVAALTETEETANPEIWNPDPTGPGDREPGAGPGKNIVLVVEDSADMQQYIRGALEQDYTVLEANTGEEGITKAKEVIPDLIISDVMMPGIDGFELCGTLKKEIRTSHVPIILLTAKASEADILEGLETGADDYITKPFSTKILSARIKNLIDLRLQLQQNLKREMILQPVKASISKMDKEFLKEFQKVIEENITESDFNVEQLSKKLYMSRATIYRKITALTGESPTEYIRSYRLRRGAELLKANSGTVLEVAMAVGFSSSAYFTKCFKDKFHQLPSEFLSSS